MVAPRPSELALAVGILEGRFVAPKHLLQGPTRHAGDDEAEDLVHTQAEIPASTIALEAPGLSREESVMMRMSELRKPPPIRRPFTNFFAAVGAFVLDTVLGPVRLYFTPARRVQRHVAGRPLLFDLVSSWIHRLRTLDGPTKVLVLAAPYVLALALAALLLERQHRVANEPITLEPATLAARAPVLVPATEPAPAPLAAPSTKSESAPEPEPAAAPAATFERHVVNLDWATSLRAKPSPRSKRVATIEAGRSLEMLVGLETEAGFVLARDLESGAVGYLQVAHLYEEPSRSKAGKTARSERRRRGSRR